MIHQNRMGQPHKDFTSQHRAIGSAAAWAVFVIGVLYTVTVVPGLLSLKSPDDPIGDPFLTIMELLIIFMSPLMVVSMVAVHAYALPEARLYSRLALVGMILMAGLTSSIHFVILAVSRQIVATGLPLASFLLSWKWPSVPLALDILAWDWFFALSMLGAAPVFKGGRLETTVRILLLISGIVSLAGLIGVPISNMQVRNIGIIGYSAVAPVAFLLMGFVFWRTRPAAKAIESNLDVQVAVAHT